MRTFLASVFCALIFLSVVAWQIQPKPEDPTKKQLSWVSDDNPARREQIDLFNKLNPGFNLKLDPNNSGAEKIIVQSIGGVGPDLFDCYGPQLSLFVKSGIAWDITDEMEKAGVDVQKMIWPSMVPVCVYEGRVYGFPTNTGGSAIWYNKDIFDKYGVPYPKGPWKWQEFIKLAQKMTIRDKKGRVLQYGFLYDWYHWQQFVMQWGGKIYSDDGTKCVVNNPEAIAATQFMHDLIYKYKVSPTPVEESAMSAAGGWGSGTISWFGAGRGAMSLGGRWWLCNLRSYEGLRLGAAYCPYEKANVTVLSGRATLINKNSPRRKEALEFLKYESQREYNELINHQADGLGAVMEFSYSDKYLHDPEFPGEDCNEVWRDSCKRALPEQLSPFVQGQVAARIIGKQLDLVKTNHKTPAAAMATMEREINREIQKNLEIDPSLRKKYDELTGRKGK